MKSFQVFKEDSQEAKERQLQSLKDLEARREKAQKKSREISGSFKDRTRKNVKKIKRKHLDIMQKYHEKQAEMKDKGLR
jgi:hypothetical protein